LRRECAWILAAESTMSGLEKKHKQENFVTMMRLGKMWPHFLHN
jgi:hypothetical protein